LPKGSVFALTAEYFRFGVALLMRFRSRLSVIEATPSQQENISATVRSHILATYNSLMIKHFVLTTTLLMTLASCTTEEAAGPPPLPPTLLATPLSDLAGRPGTLDRFRGRPMVINFWAAWCEPCRREIPDLITERSRLLARGLEVVGVAIETAPEAVRDFVVTQRIDYPILLAGDQGVAMLAAMGNNSGGLPYTVVVNRKGQIMARKLGAMTKQEMAIAFESALD
jgi:thiol-disulfide isomerase/thioredoxin